MTLLNGRRDGFRESGLTMRLMRYTTGVAMAALSALVESKFGEE